MLQEKHDYNPNRRKVLYFNKHVLSEAEDGVA